MFQLYIITKIKNKYFNGLNEDNIRNRAITIPILTFHRLVPDDVKKKLFPKNQWIGSINIFEEMMKYLYDNGYKTISSEEFYNWYMGKVEYDKKTVLITIDDGFYEDYYLVYPIIKKYNFKAISFVVGIRINEKTKLYDKYTTSYLGLDIINKVRQEYPFYEFQSHSFNMHFEAKINNRSQPIIYNMTLDKIKNDCLNNDKFNFTTMAYPYGHYYAKARDVIKNHGYHIAFGFAPFKFATRNSDRYAIPRIKINGYSTIETLKKWLN